MMIRRKIVFLVFLGTLLSLVFSVAKAQVIERSGNLKEDVFSRITYPRINSRYRIPTSQDLNLWRQAVDATLGGDLNTAAQLLDSLAPSYKVVVYTDTSTEERRVYYLLLEADVTPDDLIPTVVLGWGTYFLDPAPWRELSIEVPHPVADRFTEVQGIDAFLQLRVRSLLLAGTHRCASNLDSPCSGTTTACDLQGPPTPYRVSDPAHGARNDDPTITNAFHVVHQAILQLIPPTVFLQLHGNSVSRCVDTNVLLGNTGNDYQVAAGGNILRLKASLDAVSSGMEVCDHRPGPGECDRCGTNNLQGRWTNGSTENACRISTPAVDAEQFIHIEQNQNMRFSAENRQLVIQAIANTTFLQEE